MEKRFIQGPEAQALGAAVAYGILFLLLGLVFFGGVGSVGAGRVGVFPWEVAVTVAGVVLVGALLLRRLRFRMAVELVLGLVLFLGVWLFCWYAFGEPGLVVAGAVTLAQAFYRKLWVHDLFVLIGAAGTTLYLAFLFPALTWAVLLVGLAIYDTVGGRGKWVTERLTQSVVHRGVLPVFILSDAFRAFLNPLTQEMRAKGARAIGIATLVFPAVFVAHAAVFGRVAFGVTTLVVMVVAGWGAWKRVEVPLLPLALAATIPYLLFALFV